ncbi:MAG TPA: VCBS repeat-containing protein [Phycisphaerales bacterium]|nr:VCBS repeat-containing protein [Phycisphaerales bacterium]
MMRVKLAAGAVVFVALWSVVALGAEPLLRLGPQELVQAGGAAITVPGYSVPTVADWNSDGLPDLIVGQGGAVSPGAKVRVYLNVGTRAAPAFEGFFYVQSDGAELVVTGSGCLGAYPRVVDWDGDGKKDLLIGQADGRVKIFRNIGTDAAPTFDGGTLLTVGESGTLLSVGSRATPMLVDWDNDAAIDLVAGGMDGYIHVYRNSAALPPSFATVTAAGGAIVKEGGANLYVPSGRSSPVIMDLNGDGVKDILTGNTNGELLFYANVGTDASPAFNGYVAITAGGVKIDLPGTPRSRPEVCDWTGDGYWDVLIGADGGQVRLYQSVAVAGDVDKDFDVDFGDVAAMGALWLAEGEAAAWADLDGDGDVDGVDFAILAFFWRQ